MLNNFIYAQTKDLFLEALNAGNILDEAIVFIEDTKEIWNHGHYFGMVGSGSGIDPEVLSGIETAIAVLQSDKADKSELSDYALKSELPSLDGYLTKTVADGLYATIAQYNTLSQTVDNVNTDLQTFKNNVSLTYATDQDVADAVAALVDSSPTTLDTLNELAAALGDDPNFATTVATQIGTKADQTALDATNTNVANLTTKVNGNSVSKSGETLTVSINGSSQSLTNTWRGISDAVDSTSTSVSASSKAVKTAYDKAVAAQSAANTAQTTADNKWTYSASTIAGVKVNNAVNADTATYADSAGSANSVAWSNVSSRPGNFTGASSSAAGSAGFVPAPAKGAHGYFLRGDASWQPTYNLQYLGGSSYITINVGGDANTYYPVVISGVSSKYPMQLVNISRIYNETAPDSWNTSTHKGGLTMTLFWNGSNYWDGNGSGEPCHVIYLYQSYSTMVANHGNSTYGKVVWLRGGGATYHIHSMNGAYARATVYLEGFTDGASNQFLPTTKTTNFSVGYPYAISAGSATDQTARTAAAAAQATADGKWTYNASTIAAVKVNNAGNADTVGGFTVGCNVPANAKFTDNNTTYSAGSGLSLSGTTFNHSNSVTAVGTAGLYKVKYDAQGHITGTSAVTKGDITGLGIPGSDTNTTYSAGSGIILSGTQFSHADTSTLSGSYGPTANVTGSNGATIVIPQITVDDYGHVTGVTNRTYTSVNTDTKNTAGSTNSTNKLYLIGATSQAANPQTYSNSGLYATNGTMYATAYYETSDERLKDFKEDVEVDFDKLKSIPKKYFTWKDDETQILQMGTSAQEVQAVYPELVSGDETLHVDYARLVIPALAAIDVLYEENKLLKDKLTKLEEVVYGN